THRRFIDPCREPVARVPVIPAAVHKHDPIVMAPPPITIVPLPLVIAEHRILLPAERLTAEVVIDSYIASTVKRGVLCPVDREVSLASRSRHRCRSACAINRNVVSRAELLVPRDVPFASRSRSSCAI